MKILFVNEYAPTHAVSGAEYSQMALAEGLRSRGQKVLVFAPAWKKNRPGKALTPLWFNNPLYYLYSAWQIYLTVWRKKIDLIHIHGKYVLPGAVIAGWLTGKPVVGTVRDFKFLCPLVLCFIKRPTCSFKYFISQEVPEYQRRYHGGSYLSLILAKLWQYQLKWWLNQCARVVAVSPQLAKIYRDNGVGRVESIYNLPPFSAKGRSASGGDKHIILSVGKLSYGKGTDSILAAAKLLPKYQFVFAGELNPSLKPVFLKNCRYLGKISHEAALKLYRQASVFVINSRWPEPLARVGLEALSFGLPIVASNRGGNRELVKNNGFLINPDQPKAIAVAIVKAVKQRKKLGAGSLKLLTSRFDRRQIIVSHLHLYQSLCSKS